VACIRRFLESNDLSKHADKFESQGISFPLLFDLTDDHMRELGLTIGERIRLKRVINFYQRKHNRECLVNSLITKYLDLNTNHIDPSTILNGGNMDANKTLLIGHRGACGYEPENTLQSFSKAIEMGCDGIELDVHVCKSGELIVLHDTYLDRTTNGKGYVSEKTLEELKQFDAGNGQKIPTLSEVFDLVNNRVIINIELKGYGTMEPCVELLKQYFLKGLSPSKIVVTSFIHQYIKEIRSHLPIIKTGLLIRSELLGFAALAEAADADYLVTYYEFANENVIKDAHSRGIKVMTYTVNDKKIIQELKKIGIDGIITNYPDRFFD